MKDMKGKVNKNEFIERIAKSNHIDQNQVKKVYDAIINELVDVLCEDKSLSLTGFGMFSLKSHKGHPVQFEAKKDKVDDYVVMRFTASDVLMSRIRGNIDDKKD